MNDLAREKDEVRKRFKQLRAAIPADERAAADAAIARNVLALPEFENAQLVCAYMSFGAEIDTRFLIEQTWSAGKTVALPRCVPGTRTMQWYRVTSFEGLVKSPFGVDEPADNPAAELDPTAADAAVALVPGLTFDDRGYRLGYGGGFYDVFLSGFTGTSIGLCRDRQRTERLSILDEYDLPAQIVVTESGVMRP